MIHDYLSAAQEDKMWRWEEIQSKFNLGRIPELIMHEYE